MPFQVPLGLQAGGATFGRPLPGQIHRSFPLGIQAAAPPAAVSPDAVPQPLYGGPPAHQPHPLPPLLGNEETSLLVKAIGFGFKQGQHFLLDVNPVDFGLNMAPQPLGFTKPRFLGLDDQWFGGITFDSLARRRSGEAASPLDAIITELKPTFFQGPEPEPLRLSSRDIVENADRFTTSALIKVIGGLEAAARHEGGVVGARLLHDAFELRGIVSERLAARAQQRGHHQNVSGRPDGTSLLDWGGFGGGGDLPTVNPKDP